jgi:antirestriction protein ArdC
MAYKKQSFEEKKEKIVNKLIEKMENNKVPWMKPWRYANVCRNWESQRPYSGINRLILDDGEFMTFQQIKKNKGHLQKGSHGITIFVPIPSTRRTVVVEEDENGDQVEKVKKYQYLKFTTATVFDIAQVEGIESKFEKPEPVIWEGEEHFDAFLEERASMLGVTIHHNYQGKAYYVPSLHSIYMPNRDQFETKENYYKTLLHELGHSTGHESLIDRNLTGGKTSKRYAFEELTAEIFSYAVMLEFGLSNDMTEEQTVAYLQGWKIKIQEDPDAIIKAASESEKAIKLFLEA